MLLWPEATNIPVWMKQIVETECRESNRPAPKKLVTKYTEHPLMGGYTIHSPDGEIAVVYGNGRHYGTWEETHTLLHELAHWIVGVEDRSGEYRTVESDHTPRFYEELTRLCLKYDIDITTMAEFEDSYSGPVNVYSGLAMFHARYNEPTNPWED